MEISQIALTDIIRKMTAQEYAVFRFGEKKQPYNLNIVGIRNSEAQANQFDDRLFVFWEDNRTRPFWQCLDFPITTDAGNFYHANPMNSKGTAQLCEGQYRSAWQIGYHNGKYEALVQRKEVKVFRDNDRNLIHDRRNIDKGLFGINIHASQFEAESQTVDKWSAGCQVFKNWADFQVFMALAKQSARLYGNGFTYTLFNSQEF